MKKNSFYICIYPFYYLFLRVLYIIVLNIYIIKFTIINNNKIIIIIMNNSRKKRKKNFIFLYSHIEIKYLFITN